MYVCVEWRMHCLWAPCLNDFTSGPGFPTPPFGPGGPGDPYERKNVQKMSKVSKVEVEHAFIKSSTDSQCRFWESNCHCSNITTLLHQICDADDDCRTKIRNRSLRTHNRHIIQWIWSGGMCDVSSHAHLVPRSSLLPLLSSCTRWSLKRNAEVHLKKILAWPTLTPLYTWTPIGLCLKKIWVVLPFCLGQWCPGGLEHLWVPKHPLSLFYQEGPSPPVHRMEKYGIYLNSLQSIKPWLN